MLEVKDPYYSRPEVSNSDLSELEKYWQPRELVYDLEQAYRFGSLIDAMITENHNVNYFKFTHAGYTFNKDEFAVAEAMKKAFWRDPFCSMLATHSDMQKVSVKDRFEISYDGLLFYLSVRCKWDLNAMIKLKMTGDIKSTTCTTQKQFEEAIRHFNYDRQRAWYMDIGGSDNDMLIGLSKVYPYRVFKVPVKRGGDIYNSGKAKYQDIAFKWWYLFEDLTNHLIQQPFCINDEQLIIQ